MGYGIGVLVGPRRTSVRTQLVAGMVALAAVAILASSLPAFGLIRSELERQAWNRLAGAASASEALLATDLMRLEHVAALAAERPTVQRLVRSGRLSELPAYLDAFRLDAGVDQILIASELGEVASGATRVRLSELAVAPGTARIVAIPGSGAGAALAAQAAIPGADGTTAGTVTVLRSLDEGYLNELGEITSLEYSLLLDGNRLITTLPSYPAVDPASADARPGRAEIAVAGVGFFAQTASIGDPADGLRLQSALPMDEMRHEQRQAMLVLGTTTSLAALIVSGAGVLLSRSLARPLDDLTRAAQRIRQGDLDTPVPIPPGPAEVAALASALEAGRVHTRATIETLLHEKAWSEALIQSVVEGIVTLDRGGRIATFSPGAERLIGWRAGEVVGQAAGDVFRTPDGSAFLEQVPPPGGRRAVQVVDRAGRTMTLSITDARLRLPTNGGERLALVMRDVSDDEAVRQLRSYFLANISHEFRTPLSAMHASVELLLEDLDSLSRQEIAELLHSVDLSVTGLQTLIDNLLESLSIEAGRFTIRRHDSDLDQVIEQSVRVMRPLLERREQTLRVHLPPCLPRVWMDPMRVTQVIVNLLSNASKYSPVRTPIDVTVEAVDGAALRLAVADHGEGIAPADRENLFRRFVRLEPADPGQYGVGLGLSVVKAIVEQHGGRVGVDVRPGGGSVFWFTLPLQGGIS